MILRYAKGKTVQVRMEDGLAKDTMLPEDYGHIEANQKLLHLLFQGIKLCIQLGGNASIADIVSFRNDKEVALHQRSMIGNDEKRGGFFEYVGSDFATLTKRAIATVCFGT